jgi:putative hydroxymethylpyrimidine transport system substrate-binding protein
MTPTATARRLRRLAPVAGALAAAFGLSACGAKVDRITPNPADTQTITLDLDGAPSPLDAGIYLARADGDFADAGLKVTIGTPPSDSSAINQVAYNEVDVGVASEPALMIQRDQENQRGTVLGFGAIAQRPIGALISPRSAHITSFAKLRGTTVGVLNTPGTAQMFSAALRQAGVPGHTVRRVTLDASALVGAMTSHRVDATFGGSADVQGAALRRAGDAPEIVGVTQTGIPTYDDAVLVCSETYFANHTNELRRLVQAIGRGYAAARARPAAAERALAAAAPGAVAAGSGSSATGSGSAGSGSGSAGSAGSGSGGSAVSGPGGSAASGSAGSAGSAGSTESALTALRRSLALSVPPSGEPFGWQVQKEWNVFGKWLVSHQVLQHPSWYQASTNQLLAGVGP